MTTINETINQALRASGLNQYQRQAQPVVDALVQREQQIAASLLDVAVQQGIDRDQAARTFEGLGLSMPQQPVQAFGGAAGIPPEVQQRLASLEAFARQNGFNG